MDTRSSIVTTLNTSMMVLKAYVGDLSTSELSEKPGDGCNPIGWQLGHLIAAQVSLLDMIAPGSAPKLPDGFAEKYSKEAAKSIPPDGYLPVQSYLDLFETTNAAISAAVKKMSDADLDKPGPEHFRSMFPTVGDVAVLIATHPMMHAGQIVPVRRRLGKPIVI